MSGELPQVIRQYAQPTTGGGAKAERAKRKKNKEEGLPAKLVGTKQEIGFFGHTLTGEREFFTVLAGEGAPTPTEGWPKIAKVPRFQRVSITVPEGWEPLAMTVPVLFDSVVPTKEQRNVEEDIQRLEWMAGRTPNPKTGELADEPPYVMIYSTNSAGELTNLVPKQFQTVPGRSQQWYVTDIAFDPKPDKDNSGNRIRQSATVTLTEIVSSPSALARNRGAREAVKNKYQVVRSTSAANTIKRIATSHGIAGSWKAILEANRNVTTDAEQPLRNGTKVRIPETAYRQVPR